MVDLRPQERTGAGWGRWGARGAPAATEDDDDDDIPTPNWIGECRQVTPRRGTQKRLEGNESKEEWEYPALQSRELGQCVIIKWAFPLWAPSIDGQIVENPARGCGYR